MSNNEIPIALEKYIATRDRKQKSLVSQTPLKDTFNELLYRSVEVGGRASCGCRPDQTWRFYTSWNEVVRKAISIGYMIEITPVKHVNKSPTLAGGFWESNIYTLTGYKKKSTNRRISNDE